MDAAPLTAADRREQRRLEAERRNRLAPLRAEMRRIEEDLERCNVERTAVEAQLADPALYAATTSVARGLPLRHAQLSAQIGALEERWLAIGEELEAATAAP
jgi:ATP-binding cassette subfamily F protein 3